jgi:hypothetical protein
LPVSHLSSSAALRIRCGGVDLEFRNQMQVRDAKQIVRPKDDDGTSRRRLRDKIPVWHAQILTVGKMNRKRAKRVRLAHGP